MSPVKVELERGEMSGELKNRLWSCFITLGLKQWSDAVADDMIEVIWGKFLKYPIDSLPDNRGAFGGSYSVDSFLSLLRKWYYEASWYKAFDFIEFIVQQDEYGQLEMRLNDVLKDEMSAYRLIDGQVVEINSEEEVEEIQHSLALMGPFIPVRTHLETALKLLSDRKKPDYRNSIKESISAIESIGKIYTNDPNATLGDSLKALKKNESIPENLIQAFTKLYAYTNQDNGSRHALNEDSHKATMEDARFYLVACSAFTNYIIHKMN